MATVDDLIAQAEAEKVLAGAGDEVDSLIAQAEKGKSTFGSPGESIGVRAAKNFLPNLWQGISGFVGHPVQSAEAIANTAIGGIQKAAQVLFPESPNTKRLFQDNPPTDPIGRWLTEKLVTDKNPDKTRYVQPLIDAVTKSINEPSGIPGRLGEFVAERPADALMFSSLGLKGLGKALEVPAAIPKAFASFRRAPGEALPAYGFRDLKGLTAEAPKTSEKLQELGNALDPLNLTMKAAGGLYKGIGGVGKYAMGFKTGKGAAVVDQLYNAFKQGGDVADEARKYLRGKFDAEDMIGQYQGVLKDLRDDQMANYRSSLQKLEKIDNIQVDLNPIRDSFDSKLEKDYHIKIVPEEMPPFQPPMQGTTAPITRSNITGNVTSAAPETVNISGMLSAIGNKILEKSGKNKVVAKPLEIPEQRVKLDFSHSKFASDPEGQKAIIVMREMLQNWDKNPEFAKPSSIDILKQNFDNFYSPSSAAREIVTDVRNKVKDAIVQKVPEYGKMMNDFKTTQDLFDESKKLFGIKSAADRKASADSVLKRLQQAMREDPEYRRMFLEKMEKKSGTNIQGMLSAHSMAPVLPGGLLSKGWTAHDFYALQRGGFDPALLAIMSMGSPRLSGEILNLLANVNRGAGAVRKGIIATTTPRQLTSQAAIINQKTKEKEKK